ncbi:MAG: hypothetical protein JO042_04195 [Sinobacteraceae bacterium]|nr:hypothetical protein [Nevskiaceae bacterium]
MHSVLLWPELETVLKWMFGLYVVVLLLMVFAGIKAGYSYNPDDTKLGSQTSQSETPVPQGELPEDTRK